MAKLIQRLINRGLLWVQRRTEIARFEGIALADVRRRSHHFETVMLEALRQIRDHDLRRFARVKRHIAWIVNTDLEFGGAEYSYQTRTCSVDFQEPTPTCNHAETVALYARRLIHEATHGVVASRGIPYSPQLRARIEKLCVKEENRFLDKLGPQQPDAVRSLRREFDASLWHESWTATRWQRTLASLRQFLSK